MMMMAMMMIQTRVLARRNSVWHVIRERRGRCGEYSMLLFRFLRGLGHECRWGSNVLLVVQNGGDVLMAARAFTAGTNNPCDDAESADANDDDDDDSVQDWPACVVVTHKGSSQLLLLERDCCKYCCLRL